MSRRITVAEASRWLGITLAIDEAVRNPNELGVAGFSSPKCWHVLIYLESQADSTAKYAQALEDCGFVQSTLARVLKEVETAGYVSRSYDSETREVLLKATVEGRDAVGRIFDHASRRVL